MVNNRIFYAVKQLSAKNRLYADNSVLTDAIQFYASGAIASGDTFIPLSGGASGVAIEALPATGQVITQSGEVIKYTAVSGQSGGASGALSGCTRGFDGTQPNTISAVAGQALLKYIGWDVVHGVQSVGVTTNFSLEQVFEFGQIEIYENIEALPELEVTVERVLDGTKPMWFMVTDETKTTLNEAVANYKADIGLNIYSDAQNRASGTVQQFMLMSGMFISNATYTYPVDGNFTEAITLVGNDKTWLQSANAPSGYWTAQNTTDGVRNADDEGFGSGVQRRENFDLTSTELPTDIPGIAGAGVGNAGSGVDEHLQTVTLSVDIGREDVFELGAKRPFIKTVTFPVEVSATIEVVTAEGDRVEAISDNDTNLTNQNLLIKTDSGLTVDLGSENKLLSVDFGGGDAGGGNDTVTYTYQTFNVFSISHDNPEYSRKVAAS
jgi:hypothetical protein